MKNEWFNDVEREYYRLESDIKKLKERIEAYPKGYLQINHKNGHTQYYHVLQENETKYIRKKDIQTAVLLAQKTYDFKLLKDLELRMDALKNLIDIYKTTDPFSIIDTYCPDRQKLITTNYIPDEKYAEIWQAAEYERKPFAENAPEIYTAKGERVRSKSEKIIADTLERAGVPYRYEFPLELPGGRYNELNLIHPDYMALNKTTRKEFFWEHLGLFDDPEYYSNAVRRIQYMGSKGILPGKNLILTAETKSCVLNMTAINHMIKEYLL